MDKLTEEQWKRIIKKEGCWYKPLWKVRGEYANLPFYMRLYIELKAKNEVFDEIDKIRVSLCGYCEIVLDKLKKKTHDGSKACFFSLTIPRGEEYPTICPKCKSDIQKV